IFRPSSENTAKPKARRCVPFKFVPEDYFGFFLSHGWPAKDVRYIVDAAQKAWTTCSHMGSCHVRPSRTVLEPRGARSTENSMAYVLFEPCLNLVHILIAPVCRERRGYGTKSRSTRLLPVRSRG